MDLDFYITEWDSEIHNYFDFVGFNDVWFNKYTVLGNWGFAMKPNHELAQAHLSTFKNAFMKKLEERPFYLNQCFGKSAGAVLFNCGPQYFGMIFYKHSFKNGNQDIILGNPNGLDGNAGGLDVKFLDGNNKQRVIHINGSQCGQGSWTDDYLDMTIFGFQ